MTTFLAQTTGGGGFIDTLLLPFYEPFSLACYEIYLAVIPVAYILAFLGLLKASYESQFGGLDKVWRNIVFIGLVAIAMPRFGDMVMWTQEWIGGGLVSELRLDPMGILDRFFDRFLDKMNVFEIEGASDIINLVNPLNAILGLLYDIIAFVVELLVVLILWILVVMAYLVQILALYMGISIAPIFLGMLLFDTTKETGAKYLMGLLGLCCWPLGWGVGFLVMDAIIEFGHSIPEYGIIGIIVAVIYAIPIVGPLVEETIYIIIVILAALWGLIVLLKAPKIISKSITTGTSLAMGFVGAATGTAMGAAGAAVAVAGAAAGVATAGAGGAAAGAAIGAAGKAAGGAIGSGGSSSD